MTLPRIYIPPIDVVATSDEGGLLRIRYGAVKFLGDLVVSEYPVSWLVNADDPAEIEFLPTLERTLIEEMDSFGQVLFEDIETVMWYKSKSWSVKLDEPYVWLDTFFSEFDLSNIKKHQHNKGYPILMFSQSIPLQVQSSGIDSLGSFPDAEISIVNKFRD